MMRKRPMCDNLTTSFSCLRCTGKLMTISVEEDKEDE